MRDLDRLQKKKMLVEFYSKCNKAIGRCFFFFFLIFIYFGCAGSSLLGVGFL